MAAVEETDEIRAPVGVVFAALTDPERAADWNPDIVRVWDISGPIGPGATWRQDVMMAGRMMRLQCRVMEYEPPRRGLIQVTGDQQGRVWTVCEPVRGGTRVTQGIEFQAPGGMLGALMGGAVSGIVRRELQGAMKRQKAALEGESGGQGGSGTA